ncbi:hypothetical protein D3C74_247920 [compost metagenome]
MGARKTEARATSHASWTSVRTMLTSSVRSIETADAVRVTSGKSPWLSVMVVRMMSPW